MIWQVDSRSWRYELLEKEFEEDCLKSRKRYPYDASVMTPEEVESHRTLGAYVESKWKSGQWLRLPDLEDGQTRD